MVSERCREGLAPRVQDKQGLCSPFLRRVPVVQVVGDTSKSCGTVIRPLLKSAAMLGRGHSRRRADRPSEQAPGSLG